PLSAVAAEPSVTLSIGALSPGAVTPTSTLEVAGTATNTGRTAIGRLRVRLRLSGSLDTRSELAEWAGRAPTDPAGLRVNSAYVDAPALSAGGRKPFRISVPAAALGLDGPTAPYGLAVEAVALRGGFYQRIGLTRTFVVWSPGSPGPTPGQ